MSLCKNLEKDKNIALKANDAVKVSTLRMAISAIKTFEIEKNIKEASDADVLQIIQRQIKQHKESIIEFENGKRADLVEKETKELKILESYMPEQLSEDELNAIIKEAVSQSGARTKAEIGKVMKIVMEKVLGRADGKIVRDLVLKLLK